MLEVGDTHRHHPVYRQETEVQTAKVYTSKVPTQPVCGKSGTQAQPYFKDRVLPLTTN